MEGGEGRIVWVVVADGPLMQVVFCSVELLTKYFMEIIFLTKVFLNNLLKNLFINIPLLIFVQ